MFILNREFCAGEKVSHIKISKSEHPVNINPHNIPGFIRLSKPILIPFHDVNKDPEQGQLNLNQQVLNAEVYNSFIHMFVVGNIK